MPRNEISSEKLNVNSHFIWDQSWPLLTSGSFNDNKYNCMTVGWGSIGTIWNKPFVQVFVRHHRYTFEFMELYDSFTISILGNEYKKALNLLGTKSGRDMDKISAAGLSPIASQTVSSPGFEEAELIIECKKMYWQDLDPKNFLQENIHKMYAAKDYHRVYFGEILAIYGTDKYRR